MLIMVLSVSVVSHSDTVQDIPIEESCGVSHLEHEQPNTKLPIKSSTLTTLPENGYLSIDVLLVIYTHSFQDTISQSEIELIISEVEEVRRFFARNSFCRLNINIAGVEIIDRLLTFDQFKLENNGGYGFPSWEVDGVHSVRNDLYDLGYSDGQFASVFVYYAWKNKPGIRAAYAGAVYSLSQSFLAYTAYATVPYNHVLTSSDWLFIHEFQHNIDQMFNLSGLEEYPHADKPEDYSYGIFDEGRSFCGWMLREWPRDNWGLMSPRWGTVLTFDDIDDDDFPDSDSTLAIDEVRFGSSTSSTDTDSDGLNDLDELSASYYLSTDPNIIDTDNDGEIDSSDPYPLDALEPYLQPGQMIIDGVLDNPAPPYLTSFGTDDQTNLWVDLYGCYSDTGIYLFFDVTDDSLSYRQIGIKWKDGIRVQIDALSDGFWHHGSENYEIFIIPEGDLTDPLRLIDLWVFDGSHRQDIIPASDIQSAYRITENGYTVELYVKENQPLGFIVEENWTVRLQCNVLDYDIKLEWPQGFPKYYAFTEFIKFEYKGVVTDVANNNNYDLPVSFDLSQNYPNPFNPSTIINFLIPKKTHVILDVYNLLGQKVTILVDRELSAGKHQIRWDGADQKNNKVASGIYLYRLKADDYVSSKRMFLIK